MNAECPERLVIVTGDLALAPLHVRRFTAGDAVSPDRGVRKRFTPTPDQKTAHVLYGFRLQAPTSGAAAEVARKVTASSRRRTASVPTSTSSAVMMPCAIRLGRRLAITPALVSDMPDCASVPITVLN